MKNEDVCRGLDILNGPQKPPKKKRQPAVIHCPFCEFEAANWFLRKRLDQIAWHITDKHFEFAVCHFCDKRPQDLSRHLRMGCGTGFGINYRSYNYRHIIAAWHAQVLGVNPKETAK